MVLIWIVGSRKPFSQEGTLAVASHRRTMFPADPEPKPIKTLPQALRVAALLSKASGKAHDFGKFYRMFQGKLELSVDGKRPDPDPVRHEWISLSLLVQGLMDGESAAEIVSRWEALGQSKSVIKFAELCDHLNQRDPRGFDRGLTDALSTFLFLVYTHHRLPKDDDSSGLSGNLSDTTYVPQGDHRHELLYPVAAPSEALLRSLKRTWSRLQSRKLASESGPLAWRAIGMVARAALILADHSVSSQVVNSEDAPSFAGATRAWANTIPDPEGGRRFNQELNWHLWHVGEEAARMVHRMWSFSPPGVSTSVRQALRTKVSAIPSGSRFVWQRLAVTQLSELQQTRSLPTLVLNIAGTGSGKTLGNVAMLESLRQDEPLRFATCLNLRSLTLQTHTSYLKMLGMNERDVSCVIGSAVAKKLYEHSQSPFSPYEANGISVDGHAPTEDEDGNEYAEDFDVHGSSDQTPHWLEPFMHRNRNKQAVVMTPALVCTVDYLVRAGDPTAQAHHALAMLRLMSSDLILDEIDGYDPKALVAVMRVVTMAAMWGRHVVCSSATLPVPVAMALHQAYRLGIEMGAVLKDASEAPFRCVLVDSRGHVSVGVSQDDASFEAWFGAGLAQYCDYLHGLRLQNRPAELVGMELRAGPGAIQRYSQVIAAAVLKMHARHQWPLEASAEFAKSAQAAYPGHSISIGLVRIANISNAVRVAKHLCDALPHARVACYHAQLPRLQRHLLEQVLDGALKRSGPLSEVSEMILSIPEFADAIKASVEASRSSTCFIVVATPVEEVGRDHDFDWAILEPSSSQAIVQPAGRVNRHRLAFVQEPNIAILRYNLNFLSFGGRDDRACFTRPGYESADSPYKSHDLLQLLNWNLEGDTPTLANLDARLRYGHGESSHEFAVYDNHALSKQVLRGSSRFMDSQAPLWMGYHTYANAALRDKQPTVVWSRDEKGESVRQEPIDRFRNMGWVRRDPEPDTESYNNAWLCWPHAHLVRIADQIGIDILAALAAETRKETEHRRMTFHESFGYYLD
jgi:CRISPR-associated endonuclease/helicase Cas3